MQITPDHLYWQFTISCAVSYFCQFVNELASSDGVLPSLPHSDVQVLWSTWTVCPDHTSCQGEQCSVHKFVVMLYTIEQQFGRGKHSRAHYLVKA